MEAVAWQAGASHFFAPPASSSPAQPHSADALECLHSRIALFCGESATERAPLGRFRLRMVGSGGTLGRAAEGQKQRGVKVS